MKAQIIVLAALLFAGISSIKAEKEEVLKEVSSTITTSISGTITDATTGESLVGVKVVLEELNTIAYTDFDGKFEFSQIANGLYTVYTEYVSYKTDQTISIDTKNPRSIAIALEADL